MSYWVVVDLAVVKSVQLEGEVEGEEWVVDALEDDEEGGDAKVDDEGEGGVMVDDEEEDDVEEEVYLMVDRWYEKVVVLPVEDRLCCQ